MTTDRPAATGALCCYAVATFVFAALTASVAVAGGLAPVLVALVTVMGSSLGVFLTAVAWAAVRPAVVRPALHLVEPYPRPREPAHDREAGNRKVHTA